jgi:hypothetical protein
MVPEQLPSLFRSVVKYEKEVELAGDVELVK